MRVWPCLLAVSLTACGGAAIPPSGPPVAPLAQPARAPQATNSAAEYGTLWVAWESTVFEYDVDAAASRSHKHAPVKELGPVAPGPSGAIYHAVADAAVGSDGTYYALVDTSTYPTQSTFTPSWELKIYAPAATGSDAYEQIITGTGHGVAVALDDDVIDVLVQNGDGTPRGYLASYRYASGNSPLPVRMVTFPYLPEYLALDHRGRMDVRSGSHVFVYGTQTSGAAPAPLRTITLPSAANGEFAIGPKGDLWTIQTSNGYSSQAFVYGLTTSNDGPAPDVTIPFNAAFAHGIAVDQNDTVYAGVEHGIVMVPQAAGIAGTWFSGPAWTDPAGPARLLAISIGPPRRGTCARLCARVQ